MRSVLAIGALLASCVAHAAEVPLRELVQVSETAAKSKTDDWTWLSLSKTGVLSDMPAGWMLHLDQFRFRRIAVLATQRDGHVQRIELSYRQLADNWAPGGVIAFRIDAPGRDIARLDIGLQQVDDIGIVRKVTALSPDRAIELNSRWLVLMGAFCGLLTSALVYNLFVRSSQRQSFQRWYLCWNVAVLAYGLTWTNMAAYVIPGMAGPLAFNLDMILVALIVALGSNFFIAVLERGKVPVWLRRCVKAAGLACVACGVIAASDWPLDAAVSDRLLNVMLLICVGLSLGGMVLAVIRRSRVVWLYLIGWGPVVAIYAMRSGRNFGLIGQSDAVDMATFAAIGFESLVFSLVVANRFIVLRRERDAAESSARSLEVERETLRRAAHSDFLTGLGNRAFFHESLRDLIERDVAFSLYLLDVDDLKILNDRQGHDAGDALLQHIGDLLSELECDRTRCARIGGDEFAILHEGARSQNETLERDLDDLQGTSWARHTWSGTLSLSIGSVVAESELTPDDLFQRADIALYEAKKQGRGRRERFDDKLQQQIQSRRALLKEAHEGLRRGEFILHYQPIVDVRTSELISVEALVRWKHPTRGLIGPGEFHAVFADRKMGAALQQRVLNLAIEQLSCRPDYSGTLAVNLTAAELSGRGAARRLLGQLAAAGVAPSSLCVEITEGIILGKAGDQPSEALRELHAAGVKISLDDFGTGYASLVHLKEIPIDTLKIDRSFIAAMKDGAEGEQIVRAVLALGHGLNKAVIAEGIETVGQLIRLRELGCDLAQGYLFGRPSPAFPSHAVRAAA